jgi:hypothetical protein
MKCIIYACHHAIPDRTWRLPNFSTLVSGFAAPDRAFESDLAGDNIAAALEHSEMRHQYYVWRNTLGQYDYVGFEHYRRLFFIDPLPDSRLPDRLSFVREARFKFLGDQQLALLPASAAEFDLYLAMRQEFTAHDLLRLKDWIAAHDIIVQRPLFHLALDAQWKSTHMAEHWDTLVASLVHNPYFDERRMQIDVAMKTPHYCNMYIMRAEIFDEYMKFWSASMDHIAARITPYPRLFGHFAERLFNFFLMQKRMETPLLRVGTLPHLFLQS